MTLRKEVHIKISGKHLRGTIVNGVFKSDTLVTLPKNDFSVSDVESILTELEELKAQMVACNMADVLSK